jgi:transcriptional regulator with XRE-family HTH domain
MAEEQPDPAVVFGETVTALRAAVGLTQGDLGAVLGIEKSNVSRMERGEAEPTLSRIIAIAGFFGVTVASLLDGTASVASAKIHIGASVTCDEHGTLGTQLTADEARRVRAEHLREHLASAE